MRFLAENDKCSVSFASDTKAQPQFTINYTLILVCLRKMLFTFVLPVCSQVLSRLVGVRCTPRFKQVRSRSSRTVNSVFPRLWEAHLPCLPEYLFPCSPSHRRLSFFMQDVLTQEITLFNTLLSIAVFCASLTWCALINNHLPCRQEVQERPVDRGVLSFSEMFCVWGWFQCTSLQMEKPHNLPSGCVLRVCSTIPSRVRTKHSQSVITHYYGIFNIGCESDSNVLYLWTGGCLWQYKRVLYFSILTGEINRSLLLWCSSSKLSRAFVLSGKYFHSVWYGFISL